MHIKYHNLLHEVLLSEVRSWYKEPRGQGSEGAQHISTSLSKAGTRVTAKPLSILCDTPTLLFIDRFHELEILSLLLACFELCCISTSAGQDPSDIMLLRVW